MLRRLARYRIKTVFSLAILCAANFLCSDKHKDDDPDTAAVEPVNILTEGVPDGGGTITVGGSNTELDGMSITVPASAASGGQDISVDILPPDSADTASGFVPASPVIMVYGPQRADSALFRITVPVKVDPDLVIMAFTCDSAGHIQEALPVIERTDSSITVAAASLSGVTPGLGRRKASVSDAAFTFIVRTIGSRKLSEQPVISSGFRPGVDDWEFVNYGSYIAPGGHCAGQCMSAMWYYYEKKLKGGRNLFHAFDSINVSRDKMWQDNPQGFRAASMVQNDIPFEGLMFNFFNAATDTKNYDLLTFQAFAAAMLATGEPQFVGIRSNKGGHAIIAYKVSQPEKKIYIADPNFPGEERFIAMSGDTFLPYASKQNAADIDSNSYTKFAFFAKASLVDWQKIGKRMEELENGTAGSGRFPSYSLRVAEGSGYPLTDGFSTDKDTLLFEMISKACGQSYDSDGRQFLQVFDTSGELIAESEGKNAGPVEGQVYLVLKPGKNRFGVAAWGWRPVTDTTMRKYYIDFKWLTVTYTAIAINPELASGKMDSNYTFTAKPQGESPASREFEWDFGDGSDKVTESDSVAEHKFVKSGTFTVIVSMKDGKTGKIVAQGKGRAVITGGAPVLDTLIPGSAHAFDTITIYGHNFGEAGDSSFVTFGLDDTADTYITWNDSVIVAVVPKDAQTGWFYVRCGSQSTSGVIFNLLFDRPVITAVEPERIYAGDTVTIRGRHFRQRDKGNERFCSVLFPVGTGQQISGTQWGDSLFVWTDTLVKVRATAAIMSGGLRYCADSDTSVPFPVKVGYRIGNIIAGNVSVAFDVKLQLTDTVITSQRRFYEINPQRPQIQTVSGSTFNLVYDTSWETGGSMNTRVHHRKEITLVIDFDKAVLESMSGELLDEYTNVERGTGTMTKLIIKGESLPLTVIGTGSRNIDSLSSINFSVTGDTACAQLKEFSAVTTVTTEDVVSYSCSSSTMSILYGSLSFVRGKP